jgi:iron complex outermembrane receptor protein
VEIESAAQLTSEFRVNLNYAYIDGEYTSLRDPLVNVDYSGNPVKYTPKNSFTLGANYDYGLAQGGVVTLQSDFAYSTQIHTDDADLLSRFPNLYDNTEGRTLNARLGYESENGRWTVGLFGKNLTNHYQISVADDITTFLAVPGATRYWKIFSNLPRTYGITVSFKP